jgi:hypothetical protein
MIFILGRVDHHATMGIAAGNVEKTLAQLLMEIPVEILEA